MNIGKQEVNFHLTPEWQEVRPESNGMFESMNAQDDIDQTRQRAFSENGAGPTVTNTRAADSTSDGTASAGSTSIESD